MPTRALELSKVDYRREEVECQGMRLSGLLFAGTRGRGSCLGY
jgi:hypothetical protein